MKVTSFYPVWVLHEFTKETEDYLEAMGMKMIHNDTRSFNGIEFSRYTYKNDLG